MKFSPLQHSYFIHDACLLTQVHKSIITQHLFKSFRLQIDKFEVLFLQLHLKYHCHQDFIHLSHFNPTHQSHSSDLQHNFPNFHLLRFHYASFLH